MCTYNKMSVADFNIPKPTGYSTKIHTITLVYHCMWPVKLSSKIPMASSI
eukprot:m.142890 g.142890  ORF g.142890 m.142890 type:complete len:50 (-) comp16169_c0_seq7:1267-1416(-)